MAAFVDRAVVPEVVEEAAGRVDRARMIERQRLRDVLAQEVLAVEVGQSDGFRLRRTMGIAPEPKCY
jgi:hypothetical protein